MAREPLLIFDVNETLLDIQSLAPHFTRLFGTAAVLREWFAQLIVYAEALTLNDAYEPFGELGGHVLRMLGRIHDRTITDEDVRTLGEAVATMPPHADVVPALQRLRQAGFRLFAFSNNRQAVIRRQMQHTGLGPLFEDTLSVDDRARRAKPAPEVYADVAQALATPASSLCLIACHAWDTLGAAAAGWQSALVLRPGHAPIGAGPQPTIIGDDLHDVAAQLIAH